MKTKTFITIEEALKRGNDGKNQSIKQEFVRREIYCNVGSLVEFILTASNEVANSPFTIDDLENYYAMNVDNAIDSALDYYDSNEEEMAEYANDPDTFNRRVKTRGDFEVFLRSLEEDELKELCDNFSIGYETEPQEVFEWWAVSSFMYEDLKRMGYVVCDAGSCYIWGRTTTGQAILLDYVITKICANMGILEGQENEWKV
jgi:hypothetical protein